MDDRRIPLSIGDCPKDDCNGRPSPQYTDLQWRWFVDVGNVPFRCILCDKKYNLNLTDEQKASILNRLEQISH